MPAQLNEDEEVQILQTIDMFEVIAQSNPDDYQSLSLLKEAYGKLRKPGDVIRITKQLGDAYSRLGQYAAAAEEFSHVLGMDPNDDEALSALEEARGMLSDGSETVEPLSTGRRIELDFSSITGVEAGLISLDNHSEPPMLDPQSEEITFENDGLDVFAKFLTNHRLASSEIIHAALERTRTRNESLEPGKLAGSLLAEVLKDVPSPEDEDIMNTILEQTKMGFIPLDYYEVDRQILKMLPDSLTLGRLIVPFDLMSRTLMVAICNPFDVPGKRTVQHLLDYNIQWYFATPDAIAKTLTDIFRLKGRK